MLQPCVEELKVLSEMKRDQEELQPLKLPPATADEEEAEEGETCCSVIKTEQTLQCI